MSSGMVKANEAGLVQNTPSLPRAVTWALTGATWNPARALAEITRDGFADRLPELADRMTAAMQPVPKEWLVDRLSTMSLAMVSGHWSPKQTTAWLSETARLLADLPQDIVAQAIDQAILKAERGFVPSIGEIRSIADPIHDRRRRAAARLSSLARMDAVAPAPPRADPFAVEPEIKKEDLAKPEQLAELLATMGAAVDGAGMRGARTGIGSRSVTPKEPPRIPTEADMIALMGEEAYRESQRVAAKDAQQQARAA